MEHRSKYKISDNVNVVCDVHHIVQITPMFATMGISLNFRVSGR
jgi:hypothetical protein